MTDKEYRFVYNDIDIALLKQELGALKDRHSGSGWMLPLNRVTTILDRLEALRIIGNISDDDVRDIIIDILKDQKEGKE